MLLFAPPLGSLLMCLVLPCLAPTGYLHWFRFQNARKPPRGKPPRGKPPRGKPQQKQNTRQQNHQGRREKSRNEEKREQCYTRYMYIYIGTKNLPSKEHLFFYSHILFLLLSLYASWHKCKGEVLHFGLSFLHRHWPQPPIHH